MTATKRQAEAAKELLASYGDAVNLEISEAILYSDFDLLVRFGLLPACMLPNEGARGAPGGPRRAARGPGCPSRRPLPARS